MNTKVFNFTIIKNCIEFLNYINLKVVQSVCYSGSSSLKKGINFDHISMTPINFQQEI